MIHKEDLVKIHDALNEQFWGVSGVRSEESLAATLARPHATFDAADLYPTLVDKTAAFVESLIKNHPFHEGNMRTAYVLLRFLLLQAGLGLRASEEERLAFMLAIATGQCSFEQIKTWLEEHAVPLEQQKGDKKL